MGTMYPVHESRKHSWIFFYKSRPLNASMDNANDCGNGRSYLAKTQNLSIM